MRPGDLVGAITAEAGVPGSAIGAIQIGDGFSLVDVSPEIAEGVVQALGQATLRGRVFPVRLDSSPEESGTPRGLERPAGLAPLPGSRSHAPGGNRSVAAGPRTQRTQHPLRRPPGG
jgi:hypothetical protein